MSDSFGESWDARIRERARQHSVDAQRDTLQNWLKAKDELWHETLDEHRPLALKLNWMRESLDEGTDEGLRAAASTGCEALRLLTGSRSITEELSLKAGKPLVDPTRSDISAYLEDPDLVDDFLAVERALLVRTGSAPRLATELCSLIKQFHLDSVKYKTLQPDIIDLLNNAVGKACLPYERALEAPVGKPLSPVQRRTFLRKTLRVVALIGAGGLILVQILRPFTWLEMLRGRYPRLWVVPC